jgi:hypothetical protein
MTVNMQSWFLGFVVLLLLLEVHAADVKETGATERLVSILVRLLPTKNIDDRLIE